jgi:hypothetical protein
LIQGHLEIEGADEAVALAIAKDWESRLLRVLAANTTAADELRRILAELGLLQASRQVPGSVWQSAKASGGSTVIQVGGDATLGEPPLIPRRGIGGRCTQSP